MNVLSLPEQYIYYIILMAIFSALQNIIRPSHKNNVPDFGLWNRLTIAIKAETIAINII